MGDLADRIRMLVDAAGDPWPAPIHYLETVESTNEWLKQRAREGAPAWTAVLAGSQSAGRGRHGRPWISREGDLFLSALVRPAAESTWLGLLPLAAGLAVVAGIEKLGVGGARLKWPNDVLVDGRKLAGILVEGATGGRGLETAVVGVGLNLALAPEVSARELGGTAASLQSVTGRVFDVAGAAAAVLRELRLCYDALARDSSEVIAAWMARSLPWWGHEVEARSGDATLRGRACGLDARGALLLEQPDGSRLAVLAGEVQQVRGGERR